MQRSRQCHVRACPHKRGADPSARGLLGTTGKAPEGDESRGLRAAQPIEMVVTKSTALTALAAAAGAWWLLSSLDKAKGRREGRSNSLAAGSRGSQASEAVPETADKAARGRGHEHESAAQREAGSGQGGAWGSPQGRSSKGIGSDGETTPERSNVWKVESEDRYTTLGGKEVNEFEIQLILEKDKKPVSEFWRNKYETEARRMWDVFYRVNQANFFKDRHYLDKEWDMLRTGGALKLLDAGCGVGNTALPLLSLNPDIRIWACDFSDNAVELLKQSETFDPKRCTAFAADLTKDELADKVGAGQMDIAMLIFVLSAINPDKFVVSLQNVARALRVGGEVLFRDYGLYDMAQLKMAQPKGHKISENFYVRKDGTRAYYFAEEELIQLFREAGFEVVDCEMHKRAVSNRKDNTVMHRRWVQGRFRKV